MNANIKSNIAIIVSVIALVVSSLGGGGSTQSAAAGPEAYLKSIAKQAGVSSRTYNKCIADPATEAKVQADISETNTIASFAGLQGVGTPFNLVVTPSQIIPVNGAYPFEVFDTIIKEYNQDKTVSAETLAGFEITEIDYALLDQVRGFNPEDDHYKGSADAEIAIIEYSDFECPFCSRIHSTLEQVVNTHDNTAWAYRHLPLGFHPQALPAAIASECVAEHEGNDAFWEFTDAIFADQSKLQ